MALVPYLIDYPSKGSSIITKVVHGKASLKEALSGYAGATHISTLRKGKWTPPLTQLHEDFATWEK